MSKLSQAIIAAMQIFMGSTIATYSNLLYGAYSEAYPDLYSSDSQCGFTSQTVWATDRVLTHLSTGCFWYGYLVWTDPPNAACSLTITLPPTTLVRTVLLSVRDFNALQNIGLKVSVGDELVDSTPCYFNNNPTQTSSLSGYSAWLTCDSLFGSQLFVTNPTVGFVTIFEVMAFTHYNVLPSVYSITGANPISGSLMFLKNTEIKIQSGTDTTCYTSVIATASACTGTMNDPCYPYVWFTFEAVIPFSAFLAIPRILTSLPPVTDSSQYSTSLKVEVYKKLSPSFGITTPDSAIQLVGECDPIADPLLNPESDCHTLQGNAIKVTRTIQYSQLGLCGSAILSNVCGNCSQTEISKDYIDIRLGGVADEIYYGNPRNPNLQPMNNTAIVLQYYDETTYVRIDIMSINKYPDSVSSTCGKDGYSFCNLPKTVLFLDDNGREIDLTRQTLLQYDTTTEILSVQAESAYLIGTHSFTLVASLTNYPYKGYFPKTTPFTVTVQLPTVVHTPSKSTSFEYTIGTEMTSQTYSVNLNYGTSSIQVNGQTKDIESIYGIALATSTKDQDTLISLVFNYQKEDLDNQTLTIILVFTLNNVPYAFEQIKVIYLPRQLPPVTLSPIFSTNYTYVIGSQILPLSFEINRKSGTAQITVNETTLNIEQKYGVFFSQVTSGYITYIKLVSLYDKTDLDGQTLVIQLIFTLDNQEKYTFQPIIAKYERSPDPSKEGNIEQSKNLVNTKNTTKSNATVYIPASNNSSLKVSDKIFISSVKVNKTGSMSIYFSVPMNQTINPQFKFDRIIKTNSTMAIDFIPFFLQLQLQQIDIYTGEIKSLIAPKYNATQFFRNELKLQLNFTDPKSLSNSTSKAKDLITVFLNNTQFLRSIQNELSQDYTWRADTILPVQEQDTKEFRLQQKIVQIVIITVTTIMTSHFLLNLLFAHSLQNLWGSMNILQLVLDVALLNIIMPENTLQLFSALVELSTFDYLDSEQITDFIFKRFSFSEKLLDPFNGRFESNSYTTCNFMYNMGTSFYFVVVVLTVVLIGLLAKALKIQFCPNQQVLSGLSNKFWNIFCVGLYLRLYFEVSHDVLINSLITLHTIKDVKTWGDYLSLVLAIMNVIFQIIFPFVCSILIWKKKRAKILHTNITLRKYGELNQDFYRSDNTTSMMQLLYQVFWMCRRWIVVGCIFYLKNLVSIQIGVLLTMSVLWMGYIISERPFKEPSNNRIDILNEVFYYITLDFSFSFTVINSDEQASKGIGFFLNSLVITMLALNCLIMLYGQGQLLYKHIKRSILHIQAQIKLEKVQEERKQKLQLLAELKNQSPPLPIQKLINAKTKKYKKRNRKNSKTPLREIWKIKQNPLEAIAEEIKEESEQSDRVKNLPKKKFLHEDFKMSQKVQEIRGNRLYSINIDNSIPYTQFQNQRMNVINKDLNQQKVLGSIQSVKHTQEELIKLKRLNRREDDIRKDREQWWQVQLKKRGQYVTDKTKLK